MNSIDVSLPTPLLGGLSPETFMRRHWQKKPLLIRQAVPGVTPPLERSGMFELAAQEGVESRLIQHKGRGWSMQHGPFTQEQLPRLKQRAWTLLVQGVDLHVPAAHALMSRFRFVPDARLDDVMMSFATDGGGVGPHFDSYDVFFLQVQGRRRWRIGRLADPALQPGVPLKILSNFVAEEEWLLEPGDMLYLPPRWAHDGVAEGECITCSIGFRAAARDEFGREVLQRALDAAQDAAEDETSDDKPKAAPASPLYRDPRQPATATPGRIPEAMQAFSADAVARLASDPHALACALGEWLSEPKPQVWFEEGEALAPGQGVQLDRRTRMLYDDRHVFINGESYRAAGRDAALMRRLADQRALAAADVARLSDDAAALLDDWTQAGWLQRMGR
jgi:50S ribosomal protein L16 3-hydroxylase